MCDRIVRMFVVGVCLAIASLATGSVAAGQGTAPQPQSASAFGPSDTPERRNGQSGAASQRHELEQRSGSA
jgi:hypothetical protein